MKSAIRFSFMLLVFISLSCSEDDPKQPQLPDVGLPNAQLAGNWNGTFNGDFGSAPLSCSLSENGTLDCTIPTGSPYCKIDGIWGVLNMRFNGRGDDDCVETTVSFSANADLVTLSGNWLDSEGAAGTFEMDKL